MSCSPPQLRFAADGVGLRCATFGIQYGCEEQLHLVVVFRQLGVIPVSQPNLIAYCLFGLRHSFPTPQRVGLSQNHVVRQECQMLSITRAITQHVSGSNSGGTVCVRR
jgi:hypothetical protein